MNLEEFLVSKKIVSAEEISKLKKLQREKEPGLRLDQLLLREGYVEESTLLESFSKIFGLPYSESLSPGNMEDSVLEALPSSLAKTYNFLPLKKENGCLTLATSNPLDLPPISELNDLTGCRIKLQLAPNREILRNLERLYQIGESSTEEVIKEMEEEIPTFSIEEEESLLDLAHKPPVIKLVNLVIFQALKRRASDIHVDPSVKALRIRYRIDGVLHDILKPSKSYHPAIVSRIKVMAGLNIAERRLPQDGRFKIRLEDQEVDIRVSIIPVANGERVVLRLLDRGNLLDLEGLGLNSQMHEILNDLIHLPHGIVLVTGPTGSGKTTTLYACLSRINSPEKNIITVEDPIEYQLEGVAQIQVKPEINLTFANGLRSILRHDPDIIMIGEMRDAETAEIAVRASLTGHLVFSTLHTNDTAGAITRLLDLGVEPYLLTSSVRAIIAQRLVRRICPYCKIEYKIGKELEKKELEKLGLDPKHLPKKLFKGKGCSHCLDTGYLDRVGTFEILPVQEKIERMIMDRIPSGSIKREAIKEGMVTLRSDGIDKATKGVTTLAEVLRVTQEIGE